MDRRNLFTRITNIASLTREALDEHRRRKLEESPLPALIRPPGALPVARDFLQACTRCNDCIEACPVGAISKHYGSDHRVNLTPELTPRYAPCIMCANTPCISACKTAALLPIIPIPSSTDTNTAPAEAPAPVALTPATFPKMALAVIDIDHCLSWNNISCDACANACPPALNALVPDAQKRMRVAKSRCTGCGQCLTSCPVGQPALDLEPLQSPSP